MCCNNQIHDELKSMEECTCPFCDQQLAEVKKVVESCCNEQDIETIEGMNICLNCGLVHSCEYAIEYYNFYDNMHRIRQKSVYHQKYHIENVLNSISIDKNIEITQQQKKKIHKIFIEIGKVINEVNNRRKRMIGIKYVIKKLFKMLGLPYKDINVTKSKRTLTYYEQYWEKIQSLIGDRIESIINK